MNLQKLLKLLPTIILVANCKSILMEQSVCMENNENNSYNIDKISKTLNANNNEDLSNIQNINDNKNLNDNNDSNDTYSINNDNLGNISSKNLSLILKNNSRNKESKFNKLFNEINLSNGKSSNNKSYNSSNSNNSINSFHSSRDSSNSNKKSFNSSTNSENSNITNLNNSNNNSNVANISGNVANISDLSSNSSEENIENFIKNKNTEIFFNNNIDKIATYIPTKYRNMNKNNNDLRNIISNNINDNLRRIINEGPSDEVKTWIEKKDKELQQQKRKKEDENFTQAIEKYEGEEFEERMKEREKQEKLIELEKSKLKNKIEALNNKINFENDIIDFCNKIIDLYNCILEEKDIDKKNLLCSLHEQICNIEKSIEKSEQKIQNENIITNKKTVLKKHYEKNALNNKVNIINDEEDNKNNIIKINEEINNLKTNKNKNKKNINKESDELDLKKIDSDFMNNIIDNLLDDEDEDEVNNKNENNDININIINDCKLDNSELLINKNEKSFFNKINNDDFNKSKIFNNNKNEMLYFGNINNYNFNDSKIFSNNKNEISFFYDINNDDFNDSKIFNNNINESIIDNIRNIKVSKDSMEYLFYKQFLCSFHTCTNSNRTNPNYSNYYVTQLTSNIYNLNILKSLFGDDFGKIIDKLITICENNKLLLLNSNNSENKNNKKITGKKKKEVKKDSHEYRYTKRLKTLNENYSKLLENKNNYNNNIDIEKLKDLKDQYSDLIKNICNNAFKDREIILGLARLANENLDANIKLLKIFRKGNNHEEKFNNEEALNFDMLNDTFINIKETFKDNLNECEKTRYENAKNNTKKRNNKKIKKLYNYIIDEYENVFKQDLGKGIKKIKAFELELAKLHIDKEKIKISTKYSYDITKTYKELLKELSKSPEEADRNEILKIQSNIQIENSKIKQYYNDEQKLIEKITQKTVESEKLSKEISGIFNKYINNYLQIVEIIYKNISNITKADNNYYKKLLRVNHMVMYTLNFLNNRYYLNNDYKIYNNNYTYYTVEDYYKLKDQIIQTIPNINKNTIKKLGNISELINLQNSVNNNAVANNGNKISQNINKVILNEKNCQLKENYDIFIKGTQEDIYEQLESIFKPLNILDKPLENIKDILTSIENNITSLLNYINNRANKQLASKFKVYFDFLLTYVYVEVLMFGRNLKIIGKDTLKLNNEELILKCLNKETEIFKGIMDCIAHILAYAYKFNIK